jgi:hypothetical protein
MAKEKGDRKDSIETPKEDEINEIIIDNFVGLQKAMTNLSIKFESLSSQISRLLEILELSSKEIVKEGFQDNKELTKKIDMLLEQNKIIATRMISIEEKMKIETPKPTPMMTPAPQPTIQKEMSKAPLLNQPQAQAMQTSYELPSNLSSEYMPSIGNKPKPLPKA